ncbi:MAG: endonuclease-8, partial [Glaciecola sp.]
MPEGHTLHRLAREHQRWFARRPVTVSSPQATFPGAELVNGHVLTKSEAYGKHLFHHYDTGMQVHVHLGLFGKVFTQQLEDGEPPAPPRPTSRMRVVGAGHVIDLVGATACELLSPDEADAIAARLGPDPLRPDADPDKALAALHRRSIGIGRALMDQKVLAGVGNVFRAELLFVHGIHPDVPAKSIDAETWNAMWGTLVDWLKYGVSSGRIVTTDPAEVGRSRGRMHDDERVHVYKQDTCGRCG